MLPYLITVTIVDPFAVLILPVSALNNRALIRSKVGSLFDTRAHSTSGLLSRLKSLVYNRIFTVNFSHFNFIPSE